MPDSESMVSSTLLPLKLMQSTNSSESVMQEVYSHRKSSKTVSVLLQNSESKVLSDQENITLAINECNQLGELIYYYRESCPTCVAAGPPQAFYR